MDEVKKLRLAKIKTDDGTYWFIYVNYVGWQTSHYGWRGIDEAQAQKLLESGEAYLDKEGQVHW